MRFPIEMMGISNALEREKIRLEIEIKQYKSVNGIKRRDRDFWRGEGEKR